MGLEKAGLYLPLFIDSRDGLIFSTSIPEIHSYPLSNVWERQTCVYRQFCLYQWQWVPENYFSAVRFHLKVVLIFFRCAPVLPVSVHRCHDSWYTRSLCIRVLMGAGHGWLLGLYSLGQNLAEVAWCLARPASNLGWIRRTTKAPKAQTRNGGELAFQNPPAGI